MVSGGLTGKLTKVHEYFNGSLWVSTLSGRTSEGRSIVIKLRSNEKMPVGVEITISDGEG